MSIEVKNLTKIYGSQRAVNQVSFQVNTKEIVGFLGPNGAGKSTTMKIATTYLAPSSGTVIVGGYDVLKNPLEVRRRIGYLPEHNPLYLDLYVHEYLSFCGKLYGLTGKEISRRKSEVIEQVGLVPEQHKKLGMLSKGYRQRTGLAQALLHNPEVLILDEPTTGLDPNQLAEVRNLIKSLKSDKAIVLSTHIMQEVQAICDRVVIINQGKIVADAPVKELNKKDISQRSFHLEFSDSINPNLFSSIDGVSEVSEKGNQELKLVADRDIRNDVFRLASTHNLPLVGLREETTSLEDIFHQLTRKN